MAAEAHRPVEKKPPLRRPEEFEHLPHHHRRVAGRDRSPYFPSPHDPPCIPERRSTIPGASFVAAWSRSGAQISM